MTCPVCKSKDTRRSRRQVAADYILSIFGVYPWRCRECHVRFHARLMPIGDSLHAHCPICGNQELKRISPEHVDAPLRFVWRILRVPAYRCDPCRHKYFSVRPPSRPEAPAQELSSAD